MSSSATIVFSADPTRSPHVEVAFGRSPGRGAWARATVYSGPAPDWDGPARDAAAVLSGLLPRARVAAPAFVGADALPVPAPACWAAALAHVDAAREAREARAAEASQAAEARVREACRALEPPGAFARAHQSPPSLAGAAGRGPEAAVRALFPPSLAAAAALSADEVYARVAAHARQYGSHPSFRDPKSASRVGNYIVSVFGAPLPPAVLSEVRERLARR